MSYRTKSRVSYPASETMESYRLVTLLATGQLAYNDAATKPLGAIEYPAVEVGQLMGVRTLNTEGTIEVEASGAVALGDTVIAADDGKVTVASGAGTIIGQALVGATDGGVVELLPYGYGHTQS